VLKFINGGPLPVTGAKRPREDSNKSSGRGSRLDSSSTVQVSTSAHFEKGFCAAMNKGFDPNAKFEASKAKASGLSALKKTEEGQKWARALVPKHDEEGAELNEKLNECLKNPDVFKKEHYSAFRKLLEDSKSFYDKERVKIYQRVLTYERRQGLKRANSCARRLEFWTPIQSRLRQHFRDLDPSRRQKSLGRVDKVGKQLETSP